MSENENKASGSDAADLQLARSIRELEREMQPTRDLWTGIERKIVDYPQRRKFEWTREWMPYGVAASLLVAVSALVLAVVDLKTENQEFVSFDRTIDNMESEYVRVRNPLVQEFSETNRNLDPVVLEDLYTNIEIMEQARRDIEAQVRADPGNSKLVEMLMQVHEQELELLKRDYSKPSHSM